MSEAAISEPTHRSYRLSLGRGDRSITDQGEGAETVDPALVATPGARRSIVFLSCMLRGDIEIEKDGGKVYEIPVSAYVQERLPDRPPWPDQPWRIGSVVHSNLTVSLFVSPVAFKQFWETADAPENERLDVSISGQVDPPGVVCVYEIRLEKIRTHTHPVLSELRQYLTGWTWGLAVVGGMSGIAVLAGALIRWLLSIR
jgi:hypothetical protein